MDVPDTSISLPLYFFHYYFLEAGAQEIWISQQERNMDGCDISNQLTGGFLPHPPPPPLLQDKARKSRFLGFKLSCISGAMETMEATTMCSEIIWYLVIFQSKQLNENESNGNFILDKTKVIGFANYQQSQWEDLPTWEMLLRNTLQQSS